MGQAEKVFIDPSHLDPGIKEAVIILCDNGIETFESCEGGHGHCFPEPTIRFFGDQHEGLRAAYIAMQNGLSILSISRKFNISNGEIQTPYWEMVLRSTIPQRSLSLNVESQTFTFLQGERNGRT